MDQTSAKLDYISDNETMVDYLNNEAIAKTVLRLLRQQTSKTPFHNGGGMLTGR